MPLNPFDWRGPEFLAFYFFLCLAAMVGMWIWRNASESGETGKDIFWGRKLASDPYATAYLRGGRYEVMHVAVLSLVDRGLLSMHRGTICTQRPGDADKAVHPLDKAILHLFTCHNSATTKGKRVKEMYTDAPVIAEVEHLGEELRQCGLLPDAEAKRRRLLRQFAGMAFLWLVAAYKIFLAMQRGHANFVFLIFMAFFLPLLLIPINQRFRTALGNNTLSWIKGYYENLRNRRHTFGLRQAGDELTFLAAAFGLATLPASVNAAISELELKPPQPVANTMNTGSSCGGSSCGGSSCGGGCGGGGCGGCGS